MTTALYKMLVFLCTVWVGLHGPVLGGRIRQLGGEQHLVRVEANVTTAGELAGVPPGVIAVVAYAESGLDPRRRGKKGELGYMQLLPGTPHFSEWRALCRLSPDDCDAANLIVGARYLRASWAACGANWAAALSEYRGNGCVPRAKDARPIQVARTWGTL